MMLVAWAGTSIWPLHVPADPNNREALIEGLALAPAGAQITVLLAWFLGTFAAAAVAKRLSARAWPGWTIAGVLAGAARLHLLRAFARLDADAGADVALAGRGGGGCAGQGAEGGGGGRGLGRGTRLTCVAIATRPSIQI